jgi:hypothetical protein
MRRPALLAVLAGAAIVVVGALAWWRPFLLDERTFVASIPQPSPLFSLPLIPLKAGEQTCFQPAIIDTHSERAAFLFKSVAPAGEPLRVSMSGPDYRFATGVTGGSPAGSAVSLAVPAPPRDLPLRVCIRNAGRREVSLWAANDRTRTPMTVTGAGAKLNANVQFAFYESKPTSLLGHLPIAFQRLGEFRPGLLGSWLFWPLAVICVLGLPLGALWALWRTIRDDAEAEPLADPPADVAEPTPEPTWDRASAT